MFELLGWAQLGFAHIVSIDAADHVLFLLALAAIYRGRDWRSALWVMSAFTVGHSITLALAVTRAVSFPPVLVEFLIPVTIAITGVENLVRAGRHAATGLAARQANDASESGVRDNRWRPALAGAFGLIHGAGFAGYLESLFVADVARPLLGFNIGIEVGQVVVLAVAAGAFWLVDRALRALQTRWEPMQLRMVGVSVAVAWISTVWAVERLPA